VVLLATVVEEVAVLQVESTTLYRRDNIQEETMTTATEIVVVVAAVAVTQATAEAVVVAVMMPMTPKRSGGYHG
jgi:hypothetical protein